jgi:hypothetical protein
MHRRPDPELTVARLTPWIGIAVLVLACAAPLPGQGPPRQVAGWGEVIDPDGDCQVQSDAVGVTMNVPGKLHDLSVEIGAVNAPRILKDVTGDFSARVKVPNRFGPAGPSTAPGRLPYHGAGLLLWSDPETYIRVERASIARDGKILHSAAFEVRSGGRIAHAQSMPIADGPLFLRLDRQGDQVLAFHSADGVGWIPLGSVPVAMPAKARVGVAAINSSVQPLAARLEDYRVDGGAAAGGGAAPGLNNWIIFGALGLLLAVVLLVIVIVLAVVAWALLRNPRR